MGKAEDGASIVALVTFIAEEGKAVWGSRQTSVFETVHLIHRPDCNWQSAHCVSLFSFSSLKCYVSIWYGGKLSPDPLIQLKKNSVCFPYPVLADLNPHFLVCVVSCCSSTCYCPVEQRMFLSAGGVSHPELVFVMLSAVCSSCCRYSTLGWDLLKGNSSTKNALKKPKEFIVLPSWEKV